MIPVDIDDHNCGGNEEGENDYYSVDHGSCLGVREDNEINTYWALSSEEAVKIHTGGIIEVSMIGDDMPLTRLTVWAMEQEKVEIQDDDWLGQLAAMYDNGVAHLKTNKNAFFFRVVEELKFLRSIVHGR